MSATITTTAINVSKFPSPGSFDIAIAPRPAKVNGASDIWPAYPVSGTSDKATIAKVNPFRSNRVLERVSIPEIATTMVISETAPSTEVLQAGTLFCSRMRTTPARNRLCGRARSAMKRTIVGIDARMPAIPNPMIDWGNHESSENCR